MSGPGRPYGRLLISLVALIAAVTPYLADWNETHIYHHDWSPHAKCHDGHTMLLGTALGLLSLRYLWRRNDRRARQPPGGAWFVAGLLARPGRRHPGARTAAVDPEFADRIPTVGGIQLNQVVLNAVLLTLVLAGYRWQRAALDRRPA